MRRDHRGASRRELAAGVLAVITLVLIVGGRQAYLRYLATPATR